MLLTLTLRKMRKASKLLLREVNDIIRTITIITLSNILFHKFVIIVHFHALCTLHVFPFLSGKSLLVATSSPVIFIASIII